jgi:hypothetical protein
MMRASHERLPVRILITVSVVVLENTKFIIVLKFLHLFILYLPSFLSEDERSANVSSSWKLENTPIF